MPGQSVANYTFDNANRLTQIVQGSTTVSFSYDNANRRTTLTLPDGVVVSYSYDNASQLTALTYVNGQNTVGNLTYSYDLNGRRTNVGGSFATNLPNAVSTTAYNANNQLTAWGTANLYYDLNGNMTSDGTHSYAWDARNHLSTIDSGTTASFVYDPFGRRTSKTILGTQTGFLYDGANPVQELSGSTVTANSLMGGIDEVFQRTDSAGARTFLSDALGSTVALADSTGTLQTQYTFDPFGNTTLSGSSTTNSFAYTGRELDGTGLYFYRARYYSPQTQRFVGEDPIDGLGIANGYAYASDEPVNLIDPSGLSDLIFLRASQTLIVLDGNGNIAGIYPAANNVASTARNDDGTPTGPYEPGTYPAGGYNPHPGDGPDSPIGSNGITYFPRPGCPYCGVHSGQEDIPDGLGRTGPQHATGGCLRTTDDATRKILNLRNAGDPLKHLYVR